MTENRLTHKHDFFWFRGDSEAEKIAKTAGLKRDASRNAWFTPSPYKAADLAQWADHRAEPALADLVAAIQRGKATDTDYFPPAPSDKEYKPYQRAGIEFCADLQNALIADEPGLGKTIQAIGVANANGYRRMLIVCPRTAKYNWRNETAAWHTDPPKVFVASSDNPDIPEDAETVILNYELLLRPHVAAQIGRRKFQMNVYDECHALKNPKTKRTEAILSKNGVMGLAQKNLFLSGTPILNRPIEFWPILAAASPDTIRPYLGYWDYAKYFCGAKQGRFGWDVKGATNTRELANRLYSTFMVRRLKKDVLKDLPPKTYQMIVLEPDKSIANSIKAEYQHLGLPFSETGRVSLEQLVAANGENSIFGKLSEMRKATALAKLGVCMEHILQVLENEDKIIVFAHHHEVVDKLEEMFTKEGIKTATITGRVASDKKREEAIHAFQNDPDTRVFIGSIGAAGTAITLTAANTAIFIESSWVPGEIEQAVDRCHRIGQTRNVWAQFLVVKDSVEHYMVQRAIEKLATLSKIFS